MENKRKKFEVKFHYKTKTNNHYIIFSHEKNLVKNRISCEIEFEMHACVKYQTGRVAKNSKMMGEGE